MKMIFGFQRVVTQSKHCMFFLTFMSFDVPAKSYVLSFGLRESWGITVAFLGPVSELPFIHQFS